MAAFCICWGISGRYGLIVTNAVPMVELDRLEMTLMVCSVDWVTEFGGKN